MRLDELTAGNDFTSSIELCNGCENRCQVRLFKFANGRVFASGNNCERVYSGFHEAKTRGVNMLQEKYRLLFSRTSPVNHLTSSPVLGIPRGLGIYENWPFWRTLFAECGITTVLSGASTVKLYESGVRTIMADNICFPAKLMHGHVTELAKLGVDMKKEGRASDFRIFYPFVVYEKKEDERSRNSFNCPIVSAYSDVLRSAVDTAERYGIPLDSPVVSFNDEQMLTASCVEYLASLGVKKSVAVKAVRCALNAQNDYLSTLEQLGLEVLAKAKREGRLVILLASRPYHTDPLIEHKISYAIADMGVDVITEHAAMHAGGRVYEELNAVTQWAYPNRIFKAARMVGEESYAGLQMVELTSFGCGPDAFILDEVQSVLSRYHKNLTVLKIDDVNNIGSLKLRVRSLVESLNMRDATGKDPMLANIPDKFVTTKTYVAEDRRRTILAPYFAEGYSEFLPALFSLVDYDMENLPTGTQADAETGLKYANNDVCYPATIVIGSIMNALNSGRYDLSKTAIVITQTGGQCRATNYYSLIKNAMVRSGFANVPLISLATSGDIAMTQPGFEVKWRKVIPMLAHAMAYTDALNKIYHSAAPRMDFKKADTLRWKYIAVATDAVRRRDPATLRRLLRQAVKEYSALIDTKKKVPVMGMVGEIYVKYNSFSHKNVVNWLLQEGVEVVPPSLVDFFTTSFVSRHSNRQLHVRKESTPVWLTDLIYKYLRFIVKQYDRIGRAYPYFRPSTDIFHTAQLSKQVISTAADFGEGWFLPGEICHLAEIGVKNIVSLQPFGCIANHVISKGIEKKLRSIYPDVNMLFLDFDSSTSDANVYNRLHFLVDNARKQLDNENL